MSLRDPGLQPERTELAWMRTGLGLAVVALLVLRAGVLADDRPLLVSGIVLAVLAVSAMVAGNARRRELAATSPRAASPRLMLFISLAGVFASACAAWVFMR